MANFLEVMMVVLFGVSWPLNIVKAWKARTARGMSVMFYYFIWAGYLFGIASKIVKLYGGAATPGYVWFFYILNTLMVSVGIAIYYRNAALDRSSAASAAEA
jgi:hypothetical protein